MKATMKTMRELVAGEAANGLEAFSVLGASAHPTPPFVPISLAPGFSRVSGDANAGKPFQRFTHNSQ